MAGDMIQTQAAQTDQTAQTAQTQTQADSPSPSPWNTGVAEEHLSAISGFNDTASLAKGYSELFTKMGSSVKIPTDTSPADEVSAFYKKLGKPDTQGGYATPQLEEGQEMNKEFFSNMTAAAHGANLSGVQFDRMVAGYMEYERQTKEAEITEFNRYREEADRKLHETYGADYKRNVELSARAYTKYANDDLKALLETDKFVGMRNEPSFIDMLYNIEKKTMNDTYVKGDGPPPEPKGDSYAPSSPNSPDMYLNMEGEEGVKARAYFRAKGHVYDRAD